MTPEDLKVRELLVEHIGQFAVNLFDAANDEAALHKELQRFLNFFCKALAAAPATLTHGRILLIAWWAVRPSPLIYLQAFTQFQLADWAMPCAARPLRPSRLGLVLLKHNIFLNLIVTAKLI